jgi:hypothetical protein
MVNSSEKNIGMGRKIKNLLHLQSSSSEGTSKSGFQRLSVERRAMRLKSHPISKISDLEATKIQLQSSAAVAFMKSLEKNRVKKPNKLLNMSVCSKTVLKQDLDSEEEDFDFWSDEQCLIKTTPKLKRRGIFKRSKISKQIKGLVSNFKINRSYDRME